eukprot:5733133-Pleurochrysis_carterae.AAC.1
MSTPTTLNTDISWVTAASAQFLILIPKLQPSTLRWQKLEMCCLTTSSMRLPFWGAIKMAA